jgi:hypothetical protein
MRRCSCPTVDRRACWTVRHGAAAVALEQEMGLSVSCECSCHATFEPAAEEREPGEEG